MAITPPRKGFIFWPVGTGDSTTVRISESMYLQVDLRHMAKSEDDEDTAWPVIDELIEILPEVDGDPYLSAFALTHPDKDHCQGFKELLDRVTISELWLSPRIFREYEENADLCEDAEAFHGEAMRRVKATIEAGGDPGSGDRIRIIGYDDLLEEEDFEGFPSEFLAVPGNAITVVDDGDVADCFEAFVHAPFKDDSHGERNDCSVAFQITLKSECGAGKALLMGDLQYPVVRRIFDRSDSYALEWNLLLAPHHCSKSVMYSKDEGKEEETLKADIVEDMANAALDPGYVVSSSEPVPDSNEPGDNPPHALAKVQYESIVPNEFICTQEHPDENDPQPIIFEVGENGLRYVGEEDVSEPIADTLKKISPGGVPPRSSKGFG